MIGQSPLLRNVHGLLRTTQALCMKTEMQIGRSPLLCIVHGFLRSTINTSIMRVNGNANDHSCSIFQDFKLPNHDIYQALPLIDVLIYRKFL